MTQDEAHIEAAIELSREAVATGDRPFGSLLVVDDTVVRRSTSTAVTDDDITAHPELKLARWAARELTPAERAACTMYTSTEPCEMCTTAIYYAGLDRVVYSASGESLAAVRGEATTGISSAELITRKGGQTTIDGPVREDEGVAVLEECYDD